MKNKKTFFRVLVGFLSIALLGVFVIGCNGNNDNETLGGNTQVSTQGTTDSENTVGESDNATEDELQGNTESIDGTEMIESTEETESEETEKKDLPDEAEGTLKEEEEILKITPTDDQKNNGSGSNEKEIYTVPAVATAKNPIVKAVGTTLPAEFSSGKVMAGKTLCYKLTAKKGNYLSIEDANAYIVYGGTQYFAKEGTLLFKLPEDVSVVEIGNKSGIDKKFSVSVISASVIEAPGTKDNPEQIETISKEGTIIEKKLDAGDKDGYYYVWTAKRDAMVDFEVAASSAKALAYDVIITVNGEEKSISKNGVSNDGNTTLTTSVVVAKGDVVSIQVIAKKADDDTYPAVEKAAFTARCILYGAEEYPIILALEKIPGEVKIDVPAGEKVYCNSGIIGGAELTIASATASVIYKDVTYNPTANVVKVQFAETASGGKETIDFTIQNTGTKDETYTLVFDKEYPEGSFDNPKQIEANNELKSHTFAEEDGYYYYQWTAEAAATVIFDISSTTEVGWQYSIGKGKEDNEAITHFSNDDLVVRTEQHEVKAGDILIIKIGTFEDAQLPTPEGTISFKLNFAGQTNAVVMELEASAESESMDESEETEIAEELNNTDITEVKDAIESTEEAVKEYEQVEPIEEENRIELVELISFKVIRNWCIRLFSR